MSNATVQSKIVSLMRQSRQASRLYASVRHIDANHLTHLARIQSEEWRAANDSLCKSLGEVLKRPTSSHMGQELTTLKNQFREEWRVAEKELHLGHRKLSQAVKKNDYVASTIIASGLVRWKARKEAQNAVYDELSSLVKSCRLGDSIVSDHPQCEQQEALSANGDTVETIVRSDEDRETEHHDAHSNLKGGQKAPSSERNNVIELKQNRPQELAT